MDDIFQESIINSISGNEKEIIDIQNSTIKKLNTQLSIYKTQLKEQREKIFSCDNLIINFNSLNNTYIKLKKENEIVSKKLSEKNRIINEYQNLFFESKSKILLFNQFNEILQEKINFIQSTIPKNFFQNSEFNQKLNFFELKLQNIKEEIAQKEEEFKNKNKLTEPTLNDNNDKISDTQRKIKELEFELSISKKLNEDYAKEKEEEMNKKSNDIFIAKNEANKEINEYKNKNKKLKEENEFLTEYFNNKGKEMQNILLNIKQGNNINIKELSQKDEIIKNLMKDKDILYQQIEKLNSDYILLKSIYNKKYYKLKNLVDNIEKENNEREKQINEENSKLKEEIIKLKNDIEMKKVNEDKYNREIEDFKKIIEKLENDKKIYNKSEEYLNTNCENHVFYACGYCNCKPILCKECQNMYLNNK